MTPLTWSPRACSLLALLIVFLRCCVIHFDLRIRLQRAERLIAADYDFVAGLQAVGDLDVRHTRNSCVHGTELGVLSIDNKHALHFIFLGIGWRRRGWRCKCTA